jgi:sulfatase modifying factor 1
VVGLPGWGRGAAWVDAWPREVAVPVGLSVGALAGWGALTVGGWPGLGVGAVAVVGFAWLVAQGEPRPVLEEQAAPWWEPVVGWGRRAWARLAELRERGLPEREVERGDAEATPVEPAEAPREPGPAIEPEPVQPPVDAPPIDEPAQRPSVLSGAPPSKEEVEDGPPQEPGLFTWGTPSRPLPIVRTPTRVHDFLGPMVDLPSGRFKPEGASDEVEVQALRVMVLPVTEALWHQVMEERRGHWKFEQAPVTRVSWHDAVRFCNRASVLAGYAPAYDEQDRWVPEADGFRLPTDAEWESACRAGTDTTFSWGDDEEGADAHAWFDKNSGDRAHAVARKLPNPWGLYDVHGNVWEWCTSAWSDDKVVDNAEDPRGSRVLRGGSCRNGSRVLRSSYRNWNEPTNEIGFFGFRCVRGLRRQSLLVP